MLEVWAFFPTGKLNSHSCALRTIRHTYKIRPKCQENVPRRETVNILTSCALIGFLNSEVFSHRFYSDKTASIWTICLSVFSTLLAWAAGKTWSRTDKPSWQKHFRGICGTGSERHLNFKKVLLAQRMKQFLWNLTQYLNRTQSGTDWISERKPACFLTPPGKEESIPSKNRVK